MYPQTSLKPGQTGPVVKQLQDFLVSQKLMTPAEVDTGPGIFGPKTQAALAKFQQSSPSLFNTSTATTTGTATKTQEQVDAKYHATVGNNPKVQELTKAGNTLEEILLGLQTGDISGLRNAAGQPFSTEDQQSALNQAMEDTKLYYEAQKQKETADAEAALAQKQADYQDYLIKSGEQFQADKATLDQQAANQGVLFSGGRAQKEKALQTAYERDQATKTRALGEGIGSTARDYQYKYGNEAANSLSKYYNAGGNVYNPNVATGGVSTTGLSSVYNPGQYNFQGTTNVEQKAAAQKRAAGLLWNKGNKLLASGYTN